VYLVDKVVSIEIPITSEPMRYRSIVGTLLGAHLTKRQDLETTASTLAGLTFALLALAAVAAPAHGQAQKTGPTFDCAKASGEVENLICQDPGLAALDRKMAKVYAEAMKRFPANIAAEERTVQRGWIKGRNECWKADDVRRCVDEEFRTRIVELQIRSGQLMAPRAIGYECPDKGKPFFGTFYQETDPPSAVLTYGNDQVIAFLTPSASGSKYVATNMEFWEHHGEAMVDWYGTKMTCKRLPGTPRDASQRERVPLGGTAWKLVEFQSMNDTTLRPEAGATYTLAFDRDGRLRIQADCNRGQGPWRSPENVSLEMGPFATTLMHCPSALSDRFLRDLGDVRSYVVERGHLYLSLKVDAGIYEFEPIEWIQPPK
jgi:uncharacterized protein/heat shock protein HslJ